MFISRKELNMIRDNLMVLNNAISDILLEKLTKDFKKFEEKTIEEDLQKAVNKKLAKTKKTK